MASTTTHIEMESAIDIIDKWTQSINEFDANNPTAFDSGSDGFIRLKSAGFSTDSIKQYDTNVERLILILRNYSTAIKNYLNSMIDADSDIESKMPINGKAVETTSTASTIKVDDDISEITSSSMSDLEKESDALSKTKETQSAELLFQKQQMYQLFLRSFYRKLMEKQEFDWTKYRIKKINLENISRSYRDMSNYNRYNYSINKNNYKSLGNRYINLIRNGSM